MADRYALYNRTVAETQQKAMGHVQEVGVRLWDIRWSLIKLNHDVLSLAHADPPESSFSLESTTRYLNGSILWYFPTGHLLSLLTLSCLAVASSLALSAIPVNVIVFEGPLGPLLGRPIRGASTTCR